MTLIFNDVELTNDLDLLDADDMETFEAKISACQERIKAMDQTAGNSAVMRQCCEAIEAAIDDFFGEGASRKIFPKEAHLGDHMEAYGMLCTAGGNQMAAEIKPIVDKYSPNRLSQKNTAVKSAPATKVLPLNSGGTSLDANAMAALLQVLQSTGKTGLQ